MENLRFDHLGLVVDTLDRGRQCLSSGLGIVDWTREISDEGNGVRLQFGRDPGGVCYELLEPLNESSPVYVALKTGMGILNHVAYRIDSLAVAQAHFRATGWVQAGDPKPAVAYDGHLIQFFVSPVGMVVEMIEAPRFEHVYA